VYDAGEEPPLHAPVACLPLGRHRASRAAVLASPTEVEILRYVEDEYPLSSVIISDDDVVATAEPVPGPTYISNWFGRASLEPPTATLSLLRDQVSQGYWMSGGLQPSSFPAGKKLRQQVCHLHSGSLGCVGDL
jgi:hypothetical protein